ncbi:MAG: hypothetical protein WC859_00825 [Elusimicrobiota bacterium]
MGIDFELLREIKERFDLELKRKEAIYTQIGIHAGLLLFSFSIFTRYCERFPRGNTWKHISFYSLVFLAASCAIIALIAMIRALRGRKYIYPALTKDLRGFISQAEEYYKDDKDRIATEFRKGLIESYSVSLDVFILNNDAKGEMLSNVPILILVTLLSLFASLAFYFSV